ncbi:phospholipase [Halobacteriales archaeon QS_8_69_73]|nr:MAG: phospholipase [Halobacteriales archaeon QS_8_69_73]
MTAPEDLPLVHEHRPGTAASDAPAVVLIHGRGTDERDLLPFGAQLPDELDVLGVRAPQSMGPDSYTWYDLDLSAGGLHASQPDPDGFRRSLDAVHEFVDGAVDAYDLDSDRVGLFGFSQGAITSLSALLERPEAYRWVVALNGYLAAEHADDVDAAAGTPVFVGCGAHDRVIPAERAERAADLLEEGGAEVRFEQYAVGHGTTPEEVTDVVTWVEERH